MNTNNTSNNPQGSPLTVVLTAIVALGLLSMLPWGEITGHKLKDFSLLSDIQHSEPPNWLPTALPPMRQRKKKSLKLPSHR